MKKLPRKKSKPNYQKHRVLIIISSVIGLSVLTLFFINANHTNVLGEATKSASLSHDIVLTCGQCVGQGDKKSVVSLCFHISGKDSYAKCQYGNSPTGTANGNVCVVCRAKPTLTPKPSITRTPTRKPTFSLTRPPHPSEKSEH